MVKGRSFAGRFLFIALLVFTGTIGLVAALPVLLSSSVLRQSALNAFNGVSPYKLELETWRFSWFRGMKLEGLHIRDVQGRVDMEVESVMMDRGIWSLLSSPDKGTLRVFSPKIRIVIPESVSSKKMAGEPSRRLSSDSQSSPAPISILPSIPPFILAVELVEGEVKALFPGNEEQVLMEGMNGIFHVDGVGERIDASLQSRALGSQATLTGQMKLEERGESLQAEILWSDVPLESVLSMARFFRSDLPTGSGTLLGKIIIEGPLDKVTVTGSAVGRQVSLFGGMLGEDNPFLEILKVEWKAEGQRESWDAVRLRVETPIAELEMSGSFSQEGVRSLHVLGDMDLAQAARQLPGTLHFQEGLSLQAGKASMNMDVRLAERGVDVRGEAAMEGLRGALKGRNVVMLEPIRLKLDLSSDNGQIELKTLEWRSSFGKADARGGMSDFHAQISADLSRALEEMGQFFDLDEWDARGKADLRLRISESGRDRRTLTAKFHVDRFEFLSQGRPLFPAKESILNIHADARFQEGRLAAIDQLSMEYALPLGQGKIDLEGLSLGTKKIDSLPDLRKLDGTGTLDLAMVGQAFHVLDRMPKDASMTGDLRVERLVMGVQNGEIHVSDFQLFFRDLRGIQGERSMHWENLKCTGAGKADPAGRRFEIERGSLEAGTDHIHLSSLQIGDGSDPVGTLSGEIEGNLDLARLTRANLPWLLSGDQFVDGKARFSLKARGRTWQASCILQDFVYRAGQRPPYEDKEIFFEGQVQSSPDGTVEFSELHFKAGAVSTTAQGSLKDRTGEKRLKAKGKAVWNWDRVTELMHAMGYEQVDFEGKEEGPFEVDLVLGAGSWQDILKESLLNMELNMKGMELYGFVMKDLNVPIRLRDHVGEMDVETDYDGGQIVFFPRIQIQEDATFTMATDRPIFSNIPLTDEIADDLVGRIHPVFKGATVMKGTVTMMLRDMHIPLEEAWQERASFSGALQIHDVVLGASGLLGELLGLAKIEEREYLLGNQTIDFHCQKGRIQCSTLRLRVGGYEMSLAGSVGLDQTLDYSVSIPVTQRWVGEKIYPYLQGESIRVPVSGTLTRPTIDARVFTRALTDLTTQAAGRTVRDKVIDEAGKRLKDLLE